MTELKKSAIYTDNPQTVILEKILQDPGLPREDEARIGGLSWAVDYLTCSTTNLTPKDIRVVGKKLEALSFDEMTRRPPWQVKTSKAADYFKLRSFFILKRSEGGFLLEKGFGKTLSEVDVAQVEKKPKKRFWFR